MSRPSIGITLEHYDALRRDAARWRKISALMVQESRAHYPNNKRASYETWEIQVPLIGDSPEEAIDAYGQPTCANPYKMSEDERLDSEQHGQGDK